MVAVVSFIIPFFYSPVISLVSKFEIAVTDAGTTDGNPMRYSDFKTAT